MRKKYLFILAIFLLEIPCSRAQIASEIHKPFGTCFELYTTGISSEGCIELEWQWLLPAPAGIYEFTLYQWDEVLRNWQTVSTNYDKTIQVLNVYPNVAGSNTLQTWMHDPAIGLGKIIVTPVTLTNFNANPDLYLKSGGEYIYDVIMFGSWDGNDARDLNSASAAAVRSFLNSGRGVLFGHDTQRSAAPYFASLSDKTNLHIVNDQLYRRGSERIKVNNDGFLLKYPHFIPYESILTIPLTHSSGQFARGVVWMNFPNPLVNPGIFASAEVTQNGGTNDFYLTTWNNAALIQTGHSNGASTLDEKKVIANTLWYLAQLTADTAAKVCSALDLAAPDKPTVEHLSCNQIGILSKDNGSSYRFYSKAINTSNFADTCTSNILEVINKSGLMGFYILENSNPAGVPDPSNPATVFIAATDNQLVSYIIQNLAQYVHIQAVDAAGNLSEVATFLLDECDWIITATAGAGGTIEPAGAIFVNEGDNLTFNFTPAFCYEIDSVLIDGVNNAAAVATGIYTFVNITADHTIRVLFKLIDYTTPISVLIEPGETYDFYGNILSEEGVYYHTLSTIHGCDSIIKLILTIGERFIPVIEIIDVPTEAWIGAPHRLLSKVVPENATYQAIVWSIKDTGTTEARLVTRTLIALKKGTVIVTATIANGTEMGVNYTQDFAIEVKVPYNSQIQYVIYPNPTTGEFNIKNLNLNIKFEKIQIYDMVGKLVSSFEVIYEEPADEGIILADISHVQAGVYLVAITTEKRIVAGKVVKK